MSSNVAPAVNDLTTTNKAIGERPLTLLEYAVLRVLKRAVLVTSGDQRLRLSAAEIARTLFVGLPADDQRNVLRLSVRESSVHMALVELWNMALVAGRPSELDQAQWAITTRGLEAMYRKDGTK